MTLRSRRTFLRDSALLTLWASAHPMSRALGAAAEKSPAGMRLGLVTYLWGRDWDVPTLIRNCETAGIGGVELRTTHAHGVEPSLDAAARREVRARFADSAVELVGPGSNERFDHTDAEGLRRAIETTKAFLQLSHDVGGSGVKVKPNDLHEGVDHDQTIEQIGQALNTLGRFADDLGQEVRLEAHGSCSPLPIMKRIMDVADHPRVGLCWNCNGVDVEGGLEASFRLVRDRFGETLHVRELDDASYPYEELVRLLVGTDYEGWVLLECRGEPRDRVEALKDQRKVFAAMVDKANSMQDAPECGPRVEVKHLGDRLRVEIDGALFTEYCFQDVPRPYFYPVIGPTGEPVIRHYPMAEGADEAHDHPHHRSLWYTHGDIGGFDFWHQCDIRHDGFEEISSSPDMAVIRSRNSYVDPDGNVVCTDARTHGVHRLPDATALDFTVEFHAPEGKDVVLGDTKEGSMAIRLAPTMRVQGDVGEGHIVNSEGVRDGEAWGKRAAWCDYYGPVKGETVGVALFDHPDNPRHPTWWHVRDYGLFAANPFGIHDFEGKPDGVGDLTVPAGETLTFRYRWFFHRGDEKQGRVAEAYDAWAQEKARE